MIEDTFSSTAGAVEMRGLAVVALLLDPVASTYLAALRGGAAKLASDDAKALYALGCNVGRQVRATRGRWEIAAPARSTQAATLAVDQSRTV